MLGLLLYGFFGKVVVEPIIISWLGEQVPRKGLATTLGVFNFLGMSSSVIAPSLTGKISDMTGSKINAFYISIVILIIGTTIFYLTNKLKESKEVSI
jgi:MFS-type transporter involved in bile tolerance (Atg22 family)